MEKIWKIYGEDPLKPNTINLSFKDSSQTIYNNPDSILNEYANRLYEDSNKKFIGLVTEATGGDTNEVVYALHIVAPELKGYMYRLIDVSIPNIMQPYPLEVTLFAIDPSNHRTFSCEDVVDFRNRIVNLIESPVTRIILKHLSNLIEIAQHYSIKNFVFSLTDKNPTKLFSFNEKSSPVTIKKIILSSHIGKPPDEWSKIIANTVVKIVSNRKSGDLEYVSQLSLLQFISVYQIQPILKLKLILPDYKFYSQSKLIDTEITFTLIFKDDDIKFDFFYEGTKN